MFSLNPYTYIAGGVVALALAGSFYAQGREIHKWHTKYDCVQSGLECPKGTENIPNLKATIALMTLAQKNQTQATQQTITKVIETPPQVVQLKEFKAQPLPPNCETPRIPAELEPLL